MDYFKQIIPAPEGLRVVYLDMHNEEITSRRVLALALTDGGSLVPVVLVDGVLTQPKRTDYIDDWRIELS